MTSVVSPATKQKLRIRAPAFVLQMTTAVSASSRIKPITKNLPLPLAIVTSAKWVSPCQPSS